MPTLSKKTLSIVKGIRRRDQLGEEAEILRKYENGSGPKIDFFVVQSEGSRRLMGYGNNYEGLKLKRELERAGNRKSEPKI